MSLLPLILTIVAAYGVFLFLAYLLARIFFPTINNDSEAKSKRHHGSRQVKRFAHR